jgi:ADP-ribose pyrophosphatase YjhB (NUDIX family)
MKNPMTNMLFGIIMKRFVFAGVPVIIQNSKKEILLGKRSKNVLTFPSTWGLPGGMINYGEKIEETAKREIKEELGVDIQIIKRASNIYQNLPTKECKAHSIDVVYYAKIIKGVPKAMDETEEVRWFKPSEIRDLKMAYNHKKLLQGEGII